MIQSLPSTFPTNFLLIVLSSDILSGKTSDKVISASVLSFKISAKVLVLPTPPASGAIIVSLLKSLTRLEFSKYSIMITFASTLSADIL